MSADYDLIILGGGCAGLSLAMRLSEQGALCPKLLIIEKREHYVNDRTWCFWGTADARLKHLSSHNWQNVKLKNQLDTINSDCKESPYQMLAADKFYQHALQEIAKNNRITIHLNEAVLAAPIKTNELWQVACNDYTYTAKSIVDTRPAKTPLHGDAILWQSFYGHEIEFADAVFDPNTATLMDFDDYDKDKARVCFNYVLPTSSTKALIETTVFSTRPVSHENLSAKLDAAIAQYTTKQAYTITRSEHGILPMGNTPQTSNQDKSYIHAGLFAGAARPSTGYAFQRIQRWADLCAKAIHETQYPIGHPPDSMLQSAMDKLFLQLIRARPSLAPVLFLKLFRQCDTAKLVRFLSDQAKITDYAAIILALPPAPFLKQLLTSFFEKFNGYAAKKID
jgi:lycopene beta-cyclase